jgi:hypothetical protein
VLAAAPAAPLDMPPSYGVEPASFKNLSTDEFDIMPSLPPQPAAKFKTDSVVAMPIELAMNSRRSIPFLRARSSHFSKTNSRILRCFSLCGRKNSPFDMLPSQTGVSYGTSGSALLCRLSHLYFDFPIVYLGYMQGLAGAA